MVELLLSDHVSLNPVLNACAPVTYESVVTTVLMF